MRLLHPEIEIEPGRHAQHPNEGSIGPGSGVVRLENNTTQENAYIVRLKCDNPYWQSDWYALKALPAPEHATHHANGSANGHSIVQPEADQYGPRHSWVKVYVPRGGTRDIVIAFQVPQTPASRAGLYPFQVVVETFVSGSARRDARFIELPARAIIRPFYKWNVDVTPDAQRTGRVFRRRRTFEAIVTNQGNDWLYCDLHLPRQKDLLLDAPSQRIAVPPPEPDEALLQRTIPLRAATRLKQWRGDSISQALPFSATRIDAPSVAPREEGGALAVPFNFAALSVAENTLAPAMSSASTWNGNGSGHSNAAALAMNAATVSSAAEWSRASGAVIAHETGETLQAPTDRALIYHPPLPDSLTGILGGAISGVRGVVVLVIGLCAAWIIGTLLWEQFYRNSVIAEPLTAQVAPGGDLTIAGKYLYGSRVFVNNNVEAESQKARETAASNPVAREVLRVVKPGERQYLTIRVDPRYNGQKIKITVQRAGALAFLSPLLPRYTCRTEIQVGRPPSTIIQRAMTTGGRYRPGANFLIRLSGGPPLKGAPLVTIGGIDAKVGAWRPDRLVAIIAPNCPPGLLPVEIKASDGGKVSVSGSIEVVAPTSQPGAATNPDGTPITGAGSAAPDAGAPGGAGGGSGGSSGGSAGDALGAGGSAEEIPLLPNPAIPPMPLQQPQPLQITPAPAPAKTPRENRTQIAPSPRPSATPENPTPQISPLPRASASPVPSNTPITDTPDTRPTIEPTLPKAERLLEEQIATERSGR